MERGPSLLPRMWLVRVPALLCLAFLALGLPTGVCVGAQSGGAAAPAPEPISRWRRVERWEGSFTAVSRVQASIGDTIANTFQKTTAGYIVLDKVTQTETLPGDQNVTTWAGATTWTGKATAHVTIRTEGLTKGPKGSILERDTSEGSGTSESPAQLAIRAAKNEYLGGVDSPTIDVATTKTFYLPTGAKTTYGKARDVIDITSQVGSLSDADLQSWQGRKPSPNSGDHPFKGVPPQTGLIIRGSYSGHGVSDLGVTHQEQWLQVTWTFWPAQEVDLVVDIDGYDDWLPQGNITDWTKEGNELKVKATLETNDGKPATTRKLQKIIFQLDQVSQEPGVCLNSPIYRGVAPMEADDLYFDPGKQPAGVQAIAEERRLDAPGAGNTASAVVSCRDFGAWGVLRVTGIMEGGSGELPGHLRGDPARIDITIPHTADDSIVATAWKKANHAEDLEDNRDYEVIGGYQHPGDGLSVYEEYRGFVVRGKHVRTAPRRKTLFVCTKVPHADGGLRMLEAASGIQVLRINETDYHDNTMRQINFNSGACHIVDQHGLWIVSVRLGKHIGGQSHLGPPKYVAQVELKNNNAQWDSWYRDTTIAHELCHALAVNHHGDGDHRQTFGPGVLPAYPLGGEFDIAVQGGECSGDQFCMMRYSYADLIERTPGDPKSLVDYGTYERDGSKLCTSAQGTGVNDPDRKPYPKCGPAARGRGLCLMRLAVSDVYPWLAGN